MRFAFDVGTDSLGWVVLHLGPEGQPVGLLDLGVRLFSNGREAKTSAPLNDARRLARGARRRRDRMLLRKEDFMQALVATGLMPADVAGRKALEGLDPYVLRRKGLDEALTPHELGRALFHLAQRRGFRSNRKANPADDDDQGKIRSAVEATKTLMKDSGARTVGEFLARRHEKREWVRARLRGQGARAEYAFYVSRDLIAEEFDCLWSEQAARQTLHSEDGQRLRDILLRQRDLRPPVVGLCTLTHADERAPWALPVAQRFRILKELANLEVGIPGSPKRRLTTSERDILLEKLRRAKEVKFDAMRKALGLEADQRFNLESEKRPCLTGDETAARLAHKDAFGKAWHSLSLADQNEVVERLLEDEDEDLLVGWLGTHHRLSPEAARKAARTALPRGHCRFGRMLLADLVPVMQAEADDAVDPDGVVQMVPLHEDKALKRLGHHHSDHRREEGFDLLPYYGAALDRHVVGSGDARDKAAERWGALPNPTVHIALNQLRRVVNALIKVHGKPDEIVVELARELKQSKKDREKAQREQKKNQDRNDRHRDELAEMGLPDTGENRLRLRLWEELSPDPTRRHCVYSGKPISKALLFSPEVEIEHILPFRRTLDNGTANKTVSFREWNRLKGNNAPWEVFHVRPEWPAMLGRAQELPGNKRWRFEPDAMDRFEGEKDFVARQLTDTQYMARLAVEYLGSLYGRDEGSRVWGPPGRLTAMLRGKWGLEALLSSHNRKNRNDHRHHAIDAFVIGCTDRGMLNRVARAADEGRDRLIEDMPEPWPGFREALRQRLDAMVVSHKPDHGVEGKLHEETAYGPVAAPDQEDGCNLVLRKMLTALSSAEIDRIRDRHLRQRVKDCLADAAAAGESAAVALARFSEETGVTRVRILKKDETAVPLTDSNGKVRKLLIPGQQHHVDIVVGADGKWRGHGVSVFQANLAKGAEAKTASPDFRPVMRLHKGDLVEVEHEGCRKIMVVVQLEVSNNRVRLVPHQEGGEFQKRHETANDEDPFRWFIASYSTLQKGKARRVIVDAIGRVRPVPPPE